MGINGVKLLFGVVVGKYIQWSCNYGKHYISPESEKGGILWSTNKE